MVKKSAFEGKKGDVVAASVANYTETEREREAEKEKCIKEKEEEKSKDKENTQSNNARIVTGKHGLPSEAKRRDGTEKPRTTKRILRNDSRI